MAGMNFSNIAVSWKDCIGHASIYPSQYIESYVYLKFDTFSTKDWQSFSSPRLKEALFYEAQHYIDRSIYHLVTGKWLISEGRISWGLVSYYYSTFFAAQAAIRLKGILFVKVNYNSEIVVPPTHRLEVVNLLTNSFRIRQASGKAGEHTRVWREFYEAFGSGAISSRPTWKKYSPVTDETDPEQRVIEMHRRHLINYVPGHGYIEICRTDDATALQRQLNGRTLDNMARALADQDLQLEARSYLRLSMCLQIISEISKQDGIYSVHHPKLVKKRTEWVETFGCPKSLSDRILDSINA